MAETATKTLAERLLAITAEMPAIKATGQSPFSKDPALSIEDVEDAVRPLLVKHGVLIRFSTRALVRADKEWVAEVKAHVLATHPATGSDPTDATWMTDDWADCGSTPAAAYSFARKSYLKQLFHIAGEDDSTVPVETSARQRGDDTRPKIKVVSREPLGRFCPLEGGELELIKWDNGASAVCCSHWREKDGACKYREAPEAAHPLEDSEVIHDDTSIPF